MQTTTLTIDAYNRHAQEYADKFDNYEIYRNRISAFQKKYILKNTHILDLGCGPGNNIKVLFENDPTCSFTGVDLSKEFIRIARQRFPQFTFSLQDIRNLEIQSAFKAVIASFCIVHLTDEETQQFLKTLSNLLVKNGFLYLSYMNGEKSGFETTSFSHDAIFFNYYTDDFIRDLLKQNGIKMVEMSKEEYKEPDGSITIDTFIFAQKI